MQMLRALWRYRSFILSSVLREFQGRYRESLLGAFWSVANPLAMILIYTVVFGQLMKPTLPGYEGNPFAFSIYLCSGVLTWGLFSEMLSRLNGVFVDNANLMKKTNFPRICLPAIVTLSSVINFSIIFTIYLLFLLLSNHWPGWNILWFIPVMGMQLLFALSLGVILGTLNVFYRDVGQLTNVVLQFWFWLTPIVYTLPSLPEKARSIMAFNPMYPVMKAYQTIFLNHQAPNLMSFIPLAILTLILLVLGIKFFAGQVGELVDEL